MNRSRLVPSLAVAFALAAPAVASADSIVFVEGGNVWSASPDGAKKVQLTDGGDWHSPTQSDDGTIAAVRGTGPIQVMARDGRPIRTITTQPAPSSNGGTFAPRPVNLSFSPDGSKIAYSYAGSSCPPASTCDDTVSTFYTRADVTEATPHSTWGNQFNVQHPEWVTNERTLVFGGAGSQVSIDDLGPGDYSHKAWMTPNADMGDGEVSRDGRRLATTIFYGADKRIAFFAVNGDVKRETPPPQPDVACDTDPDAALADPSWSPDGAGVAYQDREGVKTFRFTGFSSAGCQGADGAAFPGASSPDWGPADPPAARYAPPTTAPPAVTGGTSGGGTGARPGSGSGTGTGTGTGPGGGGAGTGNGVTGADRPGVAITTAAKATRTALRKGLAVAVRAPGAGPVKATLTFKGRRVASGAATAKRAGDLRIRLSKVAARKAARLKGKRLKLTVTAGGTSTSRTIKVR